MPKQGWQSPSPSGKVRKRRRMLTLAEKVQLIDKLKSGQSYAAVARVCDSTVRYIKKDKANIWRTHALSFCRQAKRVVTGQNRLLIRMECALILWIADCGEKNVLLDASLIRTKAKTLYDTLAIEGGDGDEEESGEGGDGDSKESQPGTSQGGEMSSSRRKG